MYPLAGQSLLLRASYKLGLGLALLGASALLFWYRSFVRPISRLQARGAILYTTIGRHPFEDSAFVLSLDTFKTSTFLHGKSPRSYVSASGSSLSSRMLVATREFTASRDKVTGRLYLFDPGERTWLAVNTFLGDALEGEGALGADGRTVAFTLAQPANPSGYEVWWADTMTGAHRKLTTATMGSWDALPQLRSDGQEVLFVRFHRTPKGILSKLLSVSSTGARETVVLEENEGAASACYSPDGKHLAVWTKNGLEVLTESDGSRKVILPWNAIPGFNITAARIFWSGMHDRIVFPLVKSRNKQYGIWWISPEGQDFTRLYEGVDAQISSVSVMSTQVQ